MSLISKLSARQLEVSKLAQEAREKEDVKQAVFLKEKEIYFKYVISHILWLEEQHHRNHIAQAELKLQSDPVYSKGDEWIMEKMLSRTLTREEYNQNLPEWYIEEAGYYSNEEDEIQPTLPSLITDLRIEQIGLSEIESEEDYELGVLQGKLIAQLKKYFEKSLIWPEALSTILKQHCHGKTKREYIEMLYQLSMDQTQELFNKIKELLSDTDEILEIIDMWIKVKWEGMVFEQISCTFFDYTKMRGLKFPVKISEMATLLGIQLIKEKYVEDKIVYDKSKEQNKWKKIQPERNTDVSFASTGRVLSKRPSLDYYDNKRDALANWPGRKDYYKVLDTQE